MSNKKLITAIITLSMLFITSFGIFVVFILQNVSWLRAGEETFPRMNIPYEFTVFSHPTFTSKEIGRFAPQHVEVLSVGGVSNAWKEISTIYGSGWIFSWGGTYALPRPMGYYMNIGDKEPLGLIGPGVIEAFAQQDNWILTQTTEGLHWVDLLFMPSFEPLQQFFENFAYDVSVFYKNLDTGFTFGHNDNKIFTSASLNKATHALYLYYLAEQGIADLSTIYTFIQEDYRGGTGVIRFMPFGRHFSHYELLMYSIRNSDNIAFRVLVEYYLNHSPSYHEFVANLGGDTSLVHNITGRQMTAAEAGFFMQKIYNYLETNSFFAQSFKHNLITSDPTIFPNNIAAQKYGAWSYAYHNMAIIYASSPFIITILTDLFENENREAILHEITTFLEEFNDRYFRTQ